GVASRALSCDGDAGVQLGRGPGGVASLVAAIAVGRGQGRHVLVRRVCGRLTRSRRVSTGVAARALVGDRELAVVPAAGLPRRRVVAGNAVGAAHRDMRCVLAGGATAVVAARTVGGSCEATVVDLG